MSYPCRGCEKRTEDCHSTCREYLERRAQDQARMQERMQERLVSQALMDSKGKQERRIFRNSKNKDKYKLSYGKK